MFRSLMAAPLWWSVSGVVVLLALLMCGMGEAALAGQSNDAEEYPDTKRPPDFSAVAEALCGKRQTRETSCRIVPASIVLTGGSGPPPTTFAKVVCQDLDDNGCAHRCDCTANELSNCVTFVTACAKNGSNVSGNKQSASCDQSDLCSSAAD